MTGYALVGFGGMCGSIVRWKISSYILELAPNTQFPWATFTINLFGCLLIGLLAGFLGTATNAYSDLRLLLITGFLGGFTTFSAFGAEGITLLRGGNTLLSAMYAASSVSFGYMLVWFGLAVASWLAGASS